jgi:hypothetical protein
MDKSVGRVAPPPPMDFETSQTRNKQVALEALLQSELLVAPGQLI